MNFVEGRVRVNTKLPIILIAFYLLVTCVFFVNCYYTKVQWHVSFWNCMQLNINSICFSPSLPLFACLTKVIGILYNIKKFHCWNCMELCMIYILRKVVTWNIINPVLSLLRYIIMYKLKSIYIIFVCMIEHYYRCI